MKVDVEQVASCVRRLTIEIPKDRVNHELRTIYSDLQKRVRLPGFRQGKVPRSILESYYRQSIEQEVLQKLVPEALSEALVKESVQSVGEPHIDQIALAKDQPLRFVATTQVIPEFALEDYRTWQFERRIPRVTEADVAQALEKLRQHHAELRTVTGRAVRPHDFVIINYAGSIDGQLVPGIAGTGIALEVGDGRLLPEIEQALIDMEQGQERRVSVSFSPDHSQEALAGKDVQFQVTVTEIKEKVLPELDDDFARAYGEVDSLEALRTRVLADVEAQVKQQAEAALRRDILERLVAAHSFEVPEVLVQEQIKRTYARQRRLETGQEVPVEDIEVDLSALDEALVEQARGAVRGQLILRRIGAEAEVTVSSEEVEAEVLSLAARTAQNAEALKKAMERNNALSTLEASLWEQKVFAVILANVQVTDTTISEAVPVSGV